MSESDIFAGMGSSVRDLLNSNPDLVDLREAETAHARVQQEAAAEATEEPGPEERREHRDGGGGDGGGGDGEQDEADEATQPGPGDDAGEEEHEVHRDPSTVTPAPVSAAPGVPYKIPQGQQVVGASASARALSVDERDLAEAGGLQAAVPTAMTFEGGNVTLREFPKALIEVLREVLRPSFGESVRSISQSRLVTGYTIAMSGITVAGLDDETMRVVIAFRSINPTMRAIDQLSANMHRQEAVLKSMFEAMKPMKATTDVLESGMSYLLAESTAALSTARIEPGTLDMNQKLVMQAMERARTMTKERVRRETYREGRPKR